MISLKVSKFILQVSNPLSATCHRLPWWGVPEVWCRQQETDKVRPHPAASHSSVPHHRRSSYHYQASPPFPVPSLQSNINWSEILDPDS